MKTVKMILAKSRNGVIGNKGTIPWKIPEDMAYFKKMTLGKTVVMGRKTWESLPDQYRPLPSRQNIVLTRDRNYSAVGALIINNLSDMFVAAAYEEIWIIGGSEIYQLAEKFASEIHVTVIFKDYVGDIYAPTFNGWKHETVEDVMDEKTNTPLLSFVKLIRNEDIGN